VSPVPPVFASIAHVLEAIASIFASVPPVLEAIEPLGTQARSRQPGRGSRK